MKLTTTKSPYSPKVVLNHKKSILEIEGDSFLLCSEEEFYKPLIQQLQSILPNLPKHLSCFFKLNHFDAKTLMFMYQILELLQTNKPGSNIYWKFHHDDKTSREDALDLPNDFPHLNFHFF
jgi:hypothetical protein